MMAWYVSMFLLREHGNSTKWAEKVARHEDRLVGEYLALPTFALVLNVPSNCPLVMMEASSGLQLIIICSSDANESMMLVSFRMS